MLKNYLKILFRQAYKHKGYILINLLGLTTALVCGIFGLAYVLDERSYDNFHADKDHIYRLYKKNVSINDGTERLTAETSGLMGPTIVQDYPSVTDFVRVLPWFDNVVMSYQETHVSVANTVFADSSFLDFFDFKLLQGNPLTALVAPSSMVVSESLAQKLFGREDPLGKVVVGLNDIEYQVTGVIEDCPGNSHIKYDALVSWTTTVPGHGPLSFSFMNNWLGQTLNTYLKVAEGVDIHELEAKFPRMMKTYFPGRADSYFLYLQPFGEVYLSSADIETAGRGMKMGNMIYVKAFGSICLFILLIAVVNYVNISTAWATKRAAEVGMRKVLGADRRQLFIQFLGEAMVLCIFSGVLAVLLADLLLPLFNELAGKSLLTRDLLDQRIILGVAAMILFTGLLSGLYPALVLAAYQPAHVLKASAKSKIAGNVPRQVLTTFQFIITIGLVAATLMVNKQTQFMRNKDLGFDKEKTLVMTLSNEIESKRLIFQKEVEQHPGILMSSICQATVGSGNFGTTVIPAGQEDAMSIQIFRSDVNFIETLGIEMAEGRPFQKYAASDSNSVIINEAFASLMGWETSLDKTIRFSPAGEKYPVIGVMKDFHFQGLDQYKVAPVVMYLYPGNARNMTLKLSGDNTPGVLRFLEATWKKYESRKPFEYYFVNDWFDSNYEAEQQLLALVTVFSVISIILCCMGLYGLTSFTVAQRTKEISLRKVFGASVGGLALLINRRFILLVVLAFTIAGPSSYYFLDKWLHSFVYHTPLDPSIFIAAVLITLVLALLTVSIQAVKASLANPINNLRES